MTRNNKTKFTTKRNILAFVLAILMCISLCFAVACKNDSSSDIPEYSYTDVDNGTIKNPNFTYGTVIMDYDDYPKTSVTGWNISKNSSAKSGVIDVTKLGWKGFMYNVYSDTGMMNYVKSLNGNFSDSDIKQLIRNENISSTPKAEDVKEYVVKNYLLSDTEKVGVKYAFKNPGVPAGATDNKIYMLNNYKTGDLGYGSVQTLTSASEVVLKTGEYAKITVSVKTANLNTETTANSSYNQEIGANIRIKNSFSGNSQALFGIYNITCTEWTDYYFYVKADDVYETKFTIELGLGYDNYYAEGTVYFDDVRVELLDKEDVASLTFTETYIDYNNLDNEDTKISAKTFENKNYLYNMSVNMANLSNSELGSFANATYDFTEYNGGISNGNPTGAAQVTKTNETNLTGVPYGIKSGIKVDIKDKPASYSIKLKGFDVASENYMTLTFFVKNQLKKMYSTDITVNILDIYGANISKERPAIAKLSDVSDDWTKLTILIQNNFDRVAYTAVRNFDLEIVIGPDTEQNSIDAYALGSVYITDPIITTGVTYQYASETDRENKEPTENYDYYTLLKSTAAGSTALYAGSPNDYAANEADSTIYNITVAPSDIGTILNKPATPKNYAGVEAGHYYIGGEEKFIDINTNPNSGLINTKYIDNYSSEIKNALDHTEDEDIQTLMITPANGKSYGFVGENHKLTANTYAKVTLKIKVAGGADAYVYLVDTTTQQKEIMTFDAFDINTDVSYNKDLPSKHIEEKELFFNLSNTDGWVDLEFYIATGNTPKELRLEIWNGSRAGSTDNKGFVFVNDVVVEYAAAFEESARWENSFTLPGSPLYNNTTKLINENGKLNPNASLIAYQRELTEREIEYNNDKNKEGENIKYYPKYIWAQTDNMIYAIYNSIDPSPADPYDNEPVDTTTEDESLIHTDPATFWLSFSSILLGVVLVLSIIALFVKNILRRRKANASDAKSHYTVKSRVSKKKPEKKEKVKKEVVEQQESVEDNDLETETEISEEETAEEVQEENQEQTLDDYVYGDVQDFGEKENQETNQDEQKKDE